MARNSANLLVNCKMHHAARLHKLATNMLLVA